MSVCFFFFFLNKKCASSFTHRCPTLPTEHFRLLLSSDISDLSQIGFCILVTSELNNFDKIVCRCVNFVLVVRTLGRFSNIYSRVNHNDKHKKVRYSVLDFMPIKYYFIYIKRIEMIMTIIEENEQSHGVCKKAFANLQNLQIEFKLCHKNILFKKNM